MYRPNQRHTTPGQDLHTVSVQRAGEAGGCVFTSASACQSEEMQILDQAQTRPDLNSILSNLSPELKLLIKSESSLNPSLNPHCLAFNRR